MAPTPPDTSRRLPSTSSPDPMARTPAPKVESRFPIVRARPDTATLDHTSVVLCKPGASVHALCDMLDAPAQKAAADNGLSVIACGPARLKARSAKQGGGHDIVRTYWLG